MSADFPEIVITIAGVGEDAKEFLVGNICSLLAISGHHVSVKLPGVEPYLFGDDDSRRRPWVMDPLHIRVVKDPTFVDMLIPPTNSGKGGQK